MSNEWTYVAGLTDQTGKAAHSACCCVRCRSTLYMNS